MLKETFNLLSERFNWFLELLIEHLSIAILACILAGIIGLLLGIMASEITKSTGITLGIINFIYTIPSISMLGFLIPFSGVGNTTAIIALTTYALLPMVRNTHTGITNVSPNIIEAAKGMGSTDFQILYKIKLPLALPVIISGIRNMFIMTIALTGIASFIGAGGLGVAIYRGITTNNGALTLAGSLIIAILALFIDFILGIVEKAIASRKHRTSKLAKPIIISILIASLIIGAFGFLSKGKAVINVATKPMTEQYILGQILKQYIEHETDLEVKVTQGVGGGTSNIHPGMKKGDFDIYPEYTGTGWSLILKHEDFFDDNMFDKLQAEYNTKEGMKWTNLYGFGNTFGVAVREELAKKYNITTFSDLAKYSKEMIFGAEYDFFEREDGYKNLSDTYNLKFKSTKDMSIGLKYKAIKEGDVDVINIFTTDAQIKSSNVRVLKDDKKLYSTYLCGNIARIDTLTKHPELEAILQKLESSIDENAMISMNYAIEIEKAEPIDVARKFLEEHNYFSEVK